MSRETLLDEAIVKAKEAEDWQLVEWLRQARGSESAARWYTEKLRDANQTIRKLLDENAKLRYENAELRKLGGFMLRCISQYHDCADCLVNGEHCEISYIESDARELGIEVDG